ncbi:hypothetical protein BFV94_1449 [Alteromonas macleodii]|uniref:Uncharacterized protein n=1 Tax=Alteromonas macleodii TaxID=28108 RepID=A0AB36FTU8_ALTMA|nr:hypothetical protein BFV95_1449 [Alteromonas macleodii]OES35705.1 hypothetical protein BFV94_1449 [Alteromonas macleodii]OES36107.1 hypothetical protein BFV93_1445 [Alteromonas macleodii]OES42163.1 hypothetical protein BFV96_1449 [Alteromonas macleodii]
MSPKKFLNSVLLVGLFPTFSIDVSKKTDIFVCLSQKA